MKTYGRLVSKGKFVCDPCKRARSFGTSSRAYQDVESSTQSSSTTTTPPPPPIPSDISSKDAAEASSVVRGPARRRAAIAETSQIPFEQLPYQCFQEARKVLQEDRQEKLRQIQTQRERIERLRALEINEPDDAIREKREVTRKAQVISMTQRLEKLKIHADYNDPIVKKTFEDGNGDLNKPIYRFLAQKKFNSMRQKILDQRVNQLNLVPDVVPSMQVNADIEVAFGRKKTQPGAFVPSLLSQRHPDISVQVFDKGERLVTIAIVDPDVPNVENDGFDNRCHFLAVNVPISPTNRRVRLEKLDPETQVAADWLPPYAQQGSPYHRLCVLVMEQRPLPGGESRIIDIAKAKQMYGNQRMNATVRAMMTRHQLKPITAFIFRTQWDEGMDTVMSKLGVSGVGEELKRKKVEARVVAKKPSFFEKYR